MLASHLNEAADCIELAAEHAEEVITDLENVTEAMVRAVAAIETLRQKLIDAGKAVAQTFVSEADDDDIQRNSVQQLRQEAVRAWFLP